MKGYWRPKHAGVDTEASQYRKRGFLLMGISIICFVIGASLAFLPWRRPFGSQSTAFYLISWVPVLAGMVSGAIGLDYLLLNVKKGG